MKEPDESVKVEGDSDEAGCPIRMGEVGDVRCGRKLHAMPDGVDEKPVCLMHSKDPRKQSGPLFDAFWREFERILEAAGEGEAHFERFVFPQLDLSKRKFRAICRFNKATFAEGANFSQANFTQHANFGEATFTKDGNFCAANFTQNADFYVTTFAQNANFRQTVFAQKADFCAATFAQNADFGGVIFTQYANFGAATFKRNAQFGSVTFKQNAYFYNATFTQAVRFGHTKFHGTANWERGRFLDRAEFRHTRFEPLGKGVPSAVFVRAKFSKPDEVIFDDVDLSHALLHSCDISQIWFPSSVRWRKREDNRGLVVFDEIFLLDREFAEELKWYEQLDYRAVEQIYHQLKKNYDSRLDYWTANEFHFGEMEMKRLAVPTDGPLLWLRRLWHRNLSFVAWYRYASDYGNSYRKPLVWLLGFLILFAALLPLPGVGLQRQGHRPTQTYTSVWNLLEGYGENLWAETRLIGKSAITSVDTATFQRSAEYAPAYPWGRVLAIVETLLTSSLFALFLLAIRRQFRR